MLSVKFNKMAVRTGVCVFISKLQVCLTAEPEAPQLQFLIL